MNQLNKISRMRPSCSVSFNPCIDCGSTFTLRRSTKRRCGICNNQTIKSRKIKGLKKIKRRCLNPDCGNRFVTYDIKQYACSAGRCSDVVTNIRRRRVRTCSIGGCSNVLKLNQRWCSECQEKHGTIRQEAYRNGEHPKRDIVFKRDNYTCQLTGIKVSKSLPVGHPNKAVRDHIIPIIKGGLDTYENSQTLSNYANLLKGIRDWSEVKNEWRND